MRTQHSVIVVPIAVNEEQYVCVCTLVVVFCMSTTQVFNFL